MTPELNEPHGNTGNRNNEGAHRACTPEQTLERMRPYFHTAGITRLAEITGLDRIGICVAQCIRPDAIVLAVEDNANARLIAAAPQMLEALRAALEAMGDTYDARDAAGTEGEQLRDQIAEAIAAATGEPADY